MWNTLNDFTWSRRELNTANTNTPPPYINPADHSQYYKLAVDLGTAAIPISHAIPSQLFHMHIPIPETDIIKTPVIEDTLIKEISTSHLISVAGYPSFTNYTYDFKDCLDYIFVDNREWQVCAVCPIKTEEELFLEKLEDQEYYPSIPSQYHPSDHIPIVCDIAFNNS